MSTYVRHSPPLVSGDPGYLVPGRMDRGPAWTCNCVAPEEPYFICALLKGHEGSHAAHDGKYQFATWSGGSATGWRSIDTAPKDLWLVVWVRGHKTYPGDDGDGGEEFWTPGLFSVPDPSHSYPDPDGTSDCVHGCGCWIGPHASGGHDGVDPFGVCPNAPRERQWLFTFKQRPDSGLQVLAWQYGPERPDDALLAEARP